MGRVVDQGGWLEDLEQRQPPIRVGDRDEANMKGLAAHPAGTGLQADSGVKAPVSER
jgi:hypothetical protein